MSGYSGTPLLKKLGIKAGSRVAFVGKPAGYEATLGELPPGIKLSEQLIGRFDSVQVFATEEADLAKRFARAKSHLLPDGMIWISWPKKSAGVKTNLNENRIREMGLALGLVDVKVCAVDETWSGLKFVYRVKDRRSLVARTSVRA